MESEKVNGVDLTFVPSKHWSGRGANDRFKVCLLKTAAFYAMFEYGAWYIVSQTLWGSWCIGKKKSAPRFYFAGDTGYCNQLFKKLGDLYGGFDVAALPIGAYKPR